MPVPGSGTKGRKDLPEEHGFLMGISSRASRGTEKSLLRSGNSIVVRNGSLIALADA